MEFKANSRSPNHINFDFLENHLNVWFVSLIPRIRIRLHSSDYFICSYRSKIFWHGIFYGSVVGQKNVCITTVCYSVWLFGSWKIILFCFLAVLQVLSVQLNNYLGRYVGLFKNKFHREVLPDGDLSQRPCADLYQTMGYTILRASRWTVSTRVPTSRIDVLNSW